MKKYFISLAMLLASSAAFAQVTVTEPEFINNYCILTSDSTFVTLPKESGTVGKHENKVKKWSKIFGKASDVVFAGGVIGAAASGSTSGMINGARVAAGAIGAGTVANTVSGLAGSEGMDIIFKGGHSSYQIDGGQNVRLLIKGENNDTDPMDCYRIVRFNTSKKERYIRWVEFEPSLIGTSEAKKAGFLQFEGHKYGESSYLLTVPASELEKGEYGIFYMSIISSTAIPVGTFSIK